MRRMISENNLSVNDLIMSFFVREGKKIREKIKTMPGIYRYSLDLLPKVVGEAARLGIPMIALFPCTPNSKKDKQGSEALNENNLICKSIKTIKKRFKEIGIMTDIALDPYTNHGHDGIIKNGYVDNDLTIEILSKQSILQASMGCI